MSIVSRIALIAAAAVLSACATVNSLSGLNRTNLVYTPPDCRTDFEYIYSGTRLDGCVVGYGNQNPEHSEAVFFGLCDLPFSFVADTVLLPVTLTLEALD